MIRILLLIALSVVGASAVSRPPLKEVWNNYTTGPIFYRWWEYADVYEKFLAKHKLGEKFTMLEIGVQSGGSINTWSQWFADTDFTYVGVDINPLSIQADVSPDDKLYVEIGSQLNVTFLQDLCVKYGPFDFIVDDGGHTTEMVMTSLRALFNPTCMPDFSYYVIEDIMTITFSADQSQYLGRTTAEYLGDVFSAMQAKDPAHHMYDPLYSGWVKRMFLADSIAVLERLKEKPKSRFGTVELLLPDDSQLVVTLDVGGSINDIPHDKLTQECEDICKANPGLVVQAGSVSECTASLKQLVIQNGHK